MSTTNNEYSKMADKASPPSPKLKNCIKAFVIGGAICTFGQFLNWGFEKMHFSEDAVKALTPSVLIVIAAILTGIGVFDKIAKHAGAGTIVPTNILKLLLVFSSLYVIIILAIMITEGVVVMQDFFDIPEKVFDTIEDTIALLKSQNISEANQIAEHFLDMPTDIVKILLTNAELFNLLGNIAPTNSHMIVSYSPLQSNNSFNTDNTQLISDVKNAFYKKCFEQGKISIEDFNALTKKES